VSESDCLRTWLVRRRERGTPLLREERGEAVPRRGSIPRCDAERTGALRSTQISRSGSEAKKRRAVADGGSGVHHPGSGGGSQSSETHYVSERWLLRVLAVVCRCRANPGDAGGNP